MCECNITGTVCSPILLSSVQKAIRLNAFSQPICYEDNYSMGMLVISL